MKKPIITTLVTCVICIFINNCYAQSFNDDSLKNDSEDYTIDYFNRAIKEQSQLFNGVEYEDYTYNIKSNPYLDDSSDWQVATVNFNGYSYRNVSVKYDLYKNELVALYYNKLTKYVLESERVKDFYFTNRHFKYIFADTVTSLPSSGFYEQLYAGKHVQALVRYTKTLQQSLETNTAQRFFTTEKKRFYIQKASNFYPVDSQGSLLDILKDKKKELSVFIKANNIKYRKQPEKALTAITSYYDTLIF